MSHGPTPLPATGDRPSDPPRPDLPHGRQPYPPVPRSRAALAELFLREYHRLGGAAAKAASTDGRAAQQLRRRAFAWRLTAGRIRALPEARWPDWLLRHLALGESLPVIGAEYARQRRYLELVTGAGVGADGQLIEHA